MCNSSKIQSYLRLVQRETTWKFKKKTKAMSPIAGIEQDAVPDCEFRIIAGLCLTSASMSHC